MGKIVIRGIMDGGSVYCSKSFRRRPAGLEKLQTKDRTMSSEEITITERALLACYNIVCLAWGQNNQQMICKTIENEIHFTKNPSIWLEIVRVVNQTYTISDKYGINGLKRIYEVTEREDTFRDYFKKPEFEKCPKCGNDIIINNKTIDYKTSYYSVLEACKKLGEELYDIKQRIER